MTLLLASLLLASTTLTPLNDLGPRDYAWGYVGGLWDEGSNSIPADHLAAGMAKASGVVPRDRNGNPAADGKIGFISIGSANTNLTFEALAARQNDARVAPNVVLINAATAIDARRWGGSWDSNYNRVKNQLLTPAGLTEQQVQVAWVQLSTEYPDPPLPIQNADAYMLKGWIAETLRALRERYPNLAIAYLSSREYGGYAKTNWNPEPFAYESGLSVRWVLLGQIEFMRTRFMWDNRIGHLDYDRNAPWVTWGPYLWADGETPRSDGLTWTAADFNNAGELLSASGTAKTSTQLFDFLMREPTAAWFRKAGVVVPQPSRSRAVRR
jgi:hypothetical protein